LHAQALLKSTPHGVTDYLQADLRDPGVILRRAAAALDFGQPAAVMRLGVHLIQDSEDPHDQDQHQKVLACICPGGTSRWARDRLSLPW
jgi:hypothetical protein